MALGKITRAGGICSIIVEQNAQKILGLADRAVILERGTIVHDAPSAALKADPAARPSTVGEALFVAVLGPGLLGLLVLGIVYSGYLF